MERIANCFQPDARHLPVVGRGNPVNQTRPRRGEFLQGCLLFALFLTAVFQATPARAAIRFDVFLGYDGILPEASWFPVACEVYNDGPPFNAIFEVSPGGFNEGQTRRMAVELPTGTLKRFVIPVFSANRYTYDWSARLLDERGKVRAESSGIRPRKQNVWQLPLMGAMTRSMPALPAPADAKNNQRELQPIVARLQPSLLPDNPLALEGLRTLYLSSEEALGNNLNVNQVNALLAWIFNGGHLIVGVEQITHINSTPWLRKLVPYDFTGMTLMQNHAELQTWLQSPGRLDGTDYKFEDPRASTSANPFAKLTPDTAFEQQPLQVATGSAKDGKILVDSADGPLVVIAKRGRGQATVLAFSPELEPFRTWINRAYFWAKMADLPPELLAERATNMDHYSGYSVDGVFGAMVDSKQIRKLPVAWLLFLLVGYLVVIGPLDQMWLKKIGRQMLTWITFPIYVALFSGLIYLIGYKLRAGETEWNELHLVDVLPLPSGEQADLRGRTYASVYSPVNARYEVASDQSVATFRGEFLGTYRQGQEASRAEVEQVGNSFRARITVPVWTSQLYVSDWLRKDTVPLTFSVSPLPTGYEVEVNNQLDQSLQQGRLVIADQVFELGIIPAGKVTRFTLPNSGQKVQSFVQAHGHMFVDAVNYRQQAFGGRNAGSITDLPASAMAACFVSELDTQRSYRNFISPPGLELYPAIERGDAVLLAWAEHFSLVKPLNQFSARRNQRNTLFRVVQPLQGKRG